MPEVYFLCRAGLIGRGAKSKLKSAVVAAAYRSGQRLEFEREQNVIDYSKRRGVLAEGIIAPEQAPKWMLDRENLWNAIETKEKRCDARLARDFTLSLPHMFSDGQRREAVENFTRQQFTARGLVADYAIHAPPEGGNPKNFHAHLLVTERPVTAEGFTRNKDRELNGKPMLDKWRGAWEAELNRIFERDQMRDRNGEMYFVDRRSYKERGIEREPGVHLGPAATALERAGIQTEAGNINRQIAARGKDFEILRDELADVQDAITAEQRHREKLQRVFERDAPAPQVEPELSPEDAADRAQAEERRREKIRLLLGDRADTTLTDEQVSDRARTKSIGRIVGEEREPIDDAELVLKPKPRDLGFGRDPGI